MKSKNTFLTALICLLLFTSLLHAQNHTKGFKNSYKSDINGDGTLNILVIGTNESINNSTEAFSPNQITLELQSILSADTSISINVNVVAEDIYRTKNVSTGIGNMQTLNLDYFCHSLVQYYYWPDGHSARLNNLSGNNGVDWDYVVIGADPYIVSTIPGYYSLGVNKIAAKVNEGGAIPLLLMTWPKDDSLIGHFEEFTYRTADGAKIPLQTVPAGLAWDALPVGKKDSASLHPTPNGAYLAAAAIYSQIYSKSASSSLYVYDDQLADTAQSTLVKQMSQIHYVGNRTFISPFKSCEISDSILIYNQTGTSTEYGIQTGLEWVFSNTPDTLLFSGTPPIHFNYGRSSKGGGTKEYQIDSSRFDFSFGFPLQDDKSTGEITMLYGLDKRVSESDVETDIGVALHMVRQSELPFGRTVPIRTLVAQMLEEIPAIDIFSDNWHMSNDLNKAIGSFIYTMLTSNCVFECAVEPLNHTSAEWRTWMAHKIGHETAWNLMHMEKISPCFGVTIDTITSCGPYTWIDGNIYATPNNTAMLTLTSSAGCDSVVMLNLTFDTLNSTVTQLGNLLTANETGANYQWLNCPNMTAINGATNQSYTATVNGDYAVIVSKNGCMDTSMCYSVVGIRIIENDFGNELLVFPNPTNGAFSIDLGEYYKTVSLTITDLNGKVILSKKYSDCQLLDLKLKEPTGVYLLLIESEDKKSTIQLVKE